MKTIKSYLPIFQGFYNTHFSCECDSDVCEDEGVLYDEVKFNYKDYQERVAHKCISSVWNYLRHSGFDINIEFEEVYSPRYYNYSNDDIYCIYTVNDEDFNDLIGYCKDNLSDFKTFLKGKYSSYSGFVSFFDTDPKTWFNEYLNEDDSKFIKVFAGILEFWLINEGYTVDEMIEDAQSEINYVDYKLVG
jgi:hypothetical protein